MDYVELHHKKRFPGKWCVVLAFITSLLVLEWAFLDRRMIVVRIMAIVIPVMAILTITISSILNVRTARMDVGNVFNGYGLMLRTHGEDNAMISYISRNNPGVNEYDVMDSHGNMHHVRMVIDHHHRVMISELSENSTWSMMRRVNS